MTKGKSYSVAEARTNLPRLLKAVERGEAIEITRRGRPVAVVVSRADYDALVGPRLGFGAAYREWRSTVADEDLALPDGFVEGLRDRSVGRDVEL